MRRPIMFNTEKSGFAPDIEPHMLDFDKFTMLKNVRWQDGSLERIGSNLAVEIVEDGLQLDSAASYVFPIRNGDNFYHLITTGLKVYLWDGTSLYDVTRTESTYSAGGIWNGAVLNGVPILNNKVDIPQAFVNPGPNVKLIDLPQWPAADRAFIIRSYLSVLIALGMTTSGSDYVYRLKWSHPADPGNLPESWDETDSTKDVALSELSSTEDVLVDGLTLGGNFIIYKQNTTWMLRPSGSGGGFNSIFSISQLFDEAGMLAPNCGLRLPKNRHFVLTDKDVILHNGNEVQSIISGVARKWLFANIEPTYYSLSYVVPRFERREVWICFPERGSIVPTLALVWHMDSGIFTVREINNCNYIASAPYQGDAENNTWDNDTGKWNTDTSYWDNFSNATLQKSLLGVNADGMVILDREDFSSAITSTIEKLDSPFGEFNRVGQLVPLFDNLKFFRTVWPRISAPKGTTFQIQFGTRDYLDENHPIQWGQVFNFRVGIDTRIDPYVRGKYLSYRISTETDQAWKFHGLQIDVAKLGQF